MNLDEYKSKRTSASALMEKLQEANTAKKGEGGGTFKKDERIWSYTKGTDGNALAIIRFLPSGGETAPIVSLFQYAFKGTSGKWYINNDPSTFGEKSPVMLYNNKLIGNRKFEDCDEATKQDIRSRPRKKQFYANILVIKDSANPSNEGKTFLWKFPQTIYDMVVSAGNKEENGDDVINPFSPLEDGANFKLKVCQVGGYTNYDKSGFMEKSALSDEVANKALGQLVDLSEFTDRKNFKSFDELQEQFNRVMDIEGDGEVAKPTIARREDVARPAPKGAPSAEAKVATKTQPKKEEVKEEESELDSDAFFSDLT